MTPLSSTRRFPLTSVVERRGRDANWHQLFWVVATLPCETDRCAKHQPEGDTNAYVVHDRTDRDTNHKPDPDKRGDGHQLFLIHHPTILVRLGKSKDPSNRSFGVDSHCVELVTADLRAPGTHYGLDGLATGSCARRFSSNRHRSRLLKGMAVAKAYLQRCLAV